MTSLREIPQHYWTRKEKIITLILFLFLWVFLFLKATFMGVYHDEIGTFYFYVQDADFFPPDAQPNANNHLLNSIFTNLSFKLFGASPLALRLPNVLSFLLFFYAIFQISGKLKSAWIRWGFLLSLSASPFLFELFASARGYGLSLAFLMAAIWTFMQVLEKSSTKFLVYTCSFLLLATAANLTLITSSFIIFLFVFLNSIRTDFKTNKKRFFIKTLCQFFLGLPFLYLVKWALDLKELGLLDYGNLDGISQNTIQPLIELSFGFYHPLAGWIIILAFWLIIVILIIHFASKKVELNNLQLFFPILLVLIIGSIYLLAFTLKIKYPEDRTAIYLFPYFLGSIAFLGDYFGQKRKVFYLSSFLLFVFPLSFISNPDFKSNIWMTPWRHSDLLFKIGAEEKSNFKFPPIFSSHGGREFSWYYSNYLNGGNQGKLEIMEYPLLQADAIMGSPGDSLILNSNISEYYDSIGYDPYVDIVYYSRKQKLEKELIYTCEIQDQFNQKSEFFDLLKINCDSLRGESIYVGVEMTLTAKKSPFQSRLVAAVDKADPLENLYYDFIQLDWLKYSYQGEQNNVLQGTLIHRIPENGDILAFYLWNPELSEFSISNGKCYLYRLK